MTINFLRYPGGKSKVIQKLMPFIEGAANGCSKYCEPFVGGGSVAVAVAKAMPNAELWLNDADPDIFAVCKVLTSKRKTDSLICTLEKWKPSVRLFRKLKNESPRSIVDRAARLIALNRMAFSGKWGTGPIGGWKQTGKWKIGVEWRLEHVISNIRHASEVLRNHKTTVTNLDFSKVIQPGWAIYLDPPYYQRGNSMYPISMTSAEHENLANIIRNQSNWVISYDDCPEIRCLYGDCDIRTLEWKYSAGIGKNVTGKELIIMPSKRVE